MTKHESFLNEKNGKMTKRSRAYIDYASSHNVDILNSFNTELQLKDTEPAIGNKLIDLLAELKGLKFLTTLVIQFKKKSKVIMQQNISPIILTQKQKGLLMRVTLMVYLK